MHQPVALHAYPPHFSPEVEPTRVCVVCRVRGRMVNDLQLPCYRRPHAHPCNASEQTALKQYSSDFLDALSPVAHESNNGAFITSCAISGLADMHMHMRLHHLVRDLGA